MGPDFDASQGFCRWPRPPKRPPPIAHAPAGHAAPGPMDRRATAKKAAVPTASPTGRVNPATISARRAQESRTAPAIPARPEVVSSAPRAPAPPQASRGLRAPKSRNGAAVRVPQPGRQSRVPRAMRPNVRASPARRPAQPIRAHRVTHPSAMANAPLPAPRPDRANSARPAPLSMRPASLPTALTPTPPDDRASPDVPSVPARRATRTGRTIRPEAVRSAHRGSASRKPPRPSARPTVPTATASQSCSPAQALHRAATSNG